MWTRADWLRIKSAPPPAEWQFFLLFCVFSAFLFYVFSTWLPGAVSLVMLGLFLVNGTILKKLNRLWFLVGSALAWLIQPLFLSVIYYVIFLPFGLFLFLLRKKKYQGQWLPYNRDCRFDKSF